MMKPMNFWLRLAGLILVAGGISACVGLDLMDDDGGSSFETEEEADDNWYHSLSKDSWIWQGSDALVIDQVLARIEEAEGPRHDPDLYDTIIAFGPGNWNYEWSREGARAFEQGRRLESLGSNAEASRRFMESAGYYALGSYPHLRSDPDAVRALEQSRIAYRAAGKYFAQPLQVMDIAHAGKSFRAYLHLPEGPGPHPLVVKSMGSDQVKEQSYRVFSKYLAPRGIAMLSLDMPGIGDSGAYDLSGESDMLHAAAVRAAARHPGIDADRIAVMGASFGGHPAARIAFRKDVVIAASVAICPPLSSVFEKGPEVYAHLPALTTDAVKDRIGLPVDASWETLADQLKQFSLEGQGLFERPSPVPLAVITTHADPVSPLSDLKPMLRAAPSHKAIILHEPGHCPDRDVRYAVAAGWLDGIFNP